MRLSIQDYCCLYLHCRYLFSKRIFIFFKFNCGCNGKLVESLYRYWKLLLFLKLWYPVSKISRSRCNFMFPILKYSNVEFSKLDLYQTNSYFYFIYIIDCHCKNCLVLCRYLLCVVGEEEDVIRCICGMFRDEGMMIQCERCLVWQHCECVQADSKTASYYCERCMPREVDLEIAMNDYTEHGHQ